MTNTTIPDVPRAKREALIAKQREVADALFLDEVVGPCTNHNECLQQQGRGYLGYDRGLMCHACQIYWFADCTRILLENYARSKR